MADTDILQPLLKNLDDAVGKLAAAPDFSKPARLGRVLDTARRVMLQDGGVSEIEARAQQLEQAGLFVGTDWASPQILVPALTTHSLKSPDAATVVTECVSALRMLAVARGGYVHPCISDEQALHYPKQMLAINLAMLFGPLTEAERETQGRLAEVPPALMRHLAERVGYEHIIDSLIDEI